MDVVFQTIRSCTPSHPAFLGLENVSQATKGTLVLIALPSQVIFYCYHTSNITISSPRLILKLHSMYFILLRLSLNRRHSNILLHCSNLALTLSLVSSHNTLLSTNYVMVSHRHDKICPNLKPTQQNWNLYTTSCPIIGK